MNLSHADMFAASAALIALAMCGLTGLNRLFWALSLQTISIGVVAAILGMKLQEPRYLWLAAVVIVVKGMAAPLFLSWIAGRLEVTRDRGRFSPTLGYFAGCAAMAGGYFLTPQIVQVSVHAGSAGMALALILTGTFLMLARRLAITQVFGFLVLENGISLYTITQTHGMPMMVEMGIVFDVLVGVMVAGLVMFRLNRSFEHIDVTRLRRLKY